MPKVARPIAPQTVAWHRQHHGKNLARFDQFRGGAVSSTFQSPSPMAAIDTVHQNDEWNLPQFSNHLRNKNGEVSSLAQGGTFYCHPTESFEFKSRVRKLDCTKCDWVHSKTITPFALRPESM